MKVFKVGDIVYTFSTINMYHSTADRNNDGLGTVISIPTPGTYCVLVGETLRTYDKNGLFSSQKEKRAHYDALIAKINEVSQSIYENTHRFSNNLADYVKLEDISDKKQ
jgi:hypothetical protein